MVQFHGLSQSKAVDLADQEQEVKANLDLGHPKDAIGGHFDVKHGMPIVTVKSTTTAFQSPLTTDRRSILSPYQPTADWTPEGTGKTDAHDERTRRLHQAQTQFTREVLPQPRREPANS